jgi:hypothetical protein
MTTAVARRAPEPVLYKIPEVMAMLRMSRGASSGRALRWVSLRQAGGVTVPSRAKYLRVVTPRRPLTEGMPDPTEMAWNPGTPFV